MNDVDSISHQKQLSLDQLHLLWIMGKNRNISVPIDKNVLLLLLKSGRLRWSQLDKKEKKLLYENLNQNIKDIVDDTTTNDQEKDDLLIALFLKEMNGEEFQTRDNQNQFEESKMNEIIMPTSDRERKIIKNFYVSHQVTTQLKQSLKDDFPEYFDKTDNVNDEHLSNVYRLVYGTSPQFFANNLFNRLMSE